MMTEDKAEVVELIERELYETAAFGEQSSQQPNFTRADFMFEIKWRAKRLHERLLSAGMGSGWRGPDAGTIEEMARIIDPSSWRVFDGYLAEMLRKYKGQDAAYDPAAFKDKASMAKARSIMALLVTQKFAPPSPLDGAGS